MDIISLVPGTLSINMLTHILSLLAGILIGALVFRRHAGKAAELESKGRKLLDILKGR